MVGRARACVSDGLAGVCICVWVGGVEGGCPYAFACLCLCNGGGGGVRVCGGGVSACVCLCLQSVLPLEFPLEGAVHLQILSQQKSVARKDTLYPHSPVFSLSRNSLSEAHVPIIIFTAWIARRSCVQPQRASDQQA